MSFARLVAKNTFFLTLAQVIGVGANLFYAVAIARYLGSASLGKFAVATSLVFIVTTASDLGLATLTIRDVAKDKSRAQSYLLNIVTLKLLLSLVAFAALFITLKLLKTPEDTSLVAYIFGISMVVTAISSPAGFLFRAHEKMEYEGLTAVLGIMASVALSAVFLIKGYGIMGIAAANLIGACISTIAIWIFYLKRFGFPRLSLDFALWRYALTAGVLLGVGAFAWVIYYRVGIVMLSVLRGDEAAGWYNAAYRVFTICNLVPAIFLGALFPRLSSDHDRPQEELRALSQRALRYLTILGIPAAMGLAILAPKIIFVVFGPEFGPSIGVLQIISWAIAVTFFANTFGFLTVSIKGKEVMYALFSFIGMVVNISLNLALIPRFGVIGAASATLATEVVVCTCFYLYVSKTLFRLPLFCILVKPTVSAFIMGLVIYFLREETLAITVPLGVVVYFAALILIRGFDVSDYRIMRSLWLPGKRLPRRM